MFSAIRRRATYANVAMTLALVFAMSGGAYAAKKYLITSTKQISPSVLKALVGKAGAAGAQGPAGPQGPAGGAGAKGETGAAGKDGANGTDGKDGATGPKGATGAQGVKGATGATGPTGTTGSPWVAGTVPKGAVLTGTWSIPYYNAAAAGEEVPFAISTGVPIKHFEATPIAVDKGIDLPGQFSSEREENEVFCPGSTTDPQPSIEPETFNPCIYVKSDTNLAFLGGQALSLSGGGEIPIVTSNAAGVAKAYGSWVLVAP